MIIVHVNRIQNMLSNNLKANVITIINIRNRGPEHSRRSIITGAGLQYAQQNIGHSEVEQNG